MKLERFSNVFTSRWLNVFESSFSHNGKEGKWYFASRSENPYDNPKCNAVVIIPKYIHPDGTESYVMIKEFRVPLMDYEWGFPAGLIEEDHTAEYTAEKELKEETGLEVTKILEVGPPTYSSSGMTDESLQVVFVECTGNPTDIHNESSELIETHIFSLEQIKELMKKEVKFSARAWCFLKGLTCTR